MLTKKLSFGLSSFVLLVLSGCAATGVNSGADRVRVSNVEPGKECKYIGEVTGNQGNFFTGAWTSNSTLETGARNDLKNKAAAMGGNYVAIITQRAGVTDRAQTNVTLSANVFRCPE